MKLRVAPYRHKKTGNVYHVLTETAEMKGTGPCRNWYRAVVYTDNVNVYCREQNDFRDKFEAVTSPAWEGGQ